MKFPAENLTCALEMLAAIPFIKDLYGNGHWKLVEVYENMVNYQEFVR